MGQALYRKYRSKSLKDVIGQEHITKTLEQALKQQRISHAYLFTGPRGVGKTSVARILAHEINKIPYTDDSTHIDIIEIDAASNRRIDEIRELRDKVHIAPTSARYKVYIIDEVHMLTREAFNALLKTLEEPPEHVVFILATTDAHKLPDTIVSRTQRFHFKPADIENLISLLKKVAKEENITITPEAIKLLAEHSDGSFRDSLSLLDQARSYGPSIDVETIQQLLGLPPSEAINSLFSTIKSDDPGTLVRQLSDLYNQGFQAATIAKQLAQLIRSDIVLNKSKSDVPSQLELLGKLVDVPPAYDPERFLEIVLLQAVTANPIQETEQLNQVANTTTSDEPVNPTPQKPQTVIAKKDKNKPINNDDLWPAVLHALKQKHNTLYGIVRMAKATITSDDSLQLTFSFAFHQKRLKESANRQLLLDTLGELTGRNMSIEFLLEPTGTSKSSTPEIKTEIQADNNLSTISNIFSGAELLES